MVGPKQAAHLASALLTAAATFAAAAAAGAAAAGLKHIILTMGSQGAAFLALQPQQQQQQQQQQNQLRPLQPMNSSSRRGRQQLVAYHIPAAPAAAVVNLSGAGDTLTGGFAAARLRGASLQEALAVGVAAARLAVECSLNVPGPSQGMQYHAVWQQAQQLLSTMQVWEFPCASAL
jgi:sugar/nucleoside kinase (ribokinase family)